MYLKFHHPHRRRATHGNWDDEEVHNRNACEKSDQHTKSIGLTLILFQSVTHVMEADFVVIEGIVAILYSQHPSRKQEPSDRA